MKRAPYVVSMISKLMIVDGNEDRTGQRVVAGRRAICRQLYALKTKSLSVTAPYLLSRDPRESGDSQKMRRDSQ
jgi:hypothetical protein